MTVFTPITARHADGTRYVDTGFIDLRPEAFVLQVKVDGNGKNGQPTIEDLTAAMRICLTGVWPGEAIKLIFGDRLYRYAELNEKAKERARNWFVGQGFYSPDAVYASEKLLAEFMDKNNFTFTEKGERF